ncbi:hypothetical protein NQ315_008167 [Exocentrus adspersus]|uniref:C2 domain-containing protein n=1 Tax=Exocentrus adspersus TaxID=1586481 RepID=A0AAV8VWY9_9CUCU|nr:hypothetical protein NQ315_008167 [Exocentrus adspersus]
MEQKLNKVKNYFTLRRSDVGLDNAVEPQIGFKVSFCEITKELRVKVIGARQLPTSYGSVKPSGYLVKKISEMPESWPTINEEFTFNLVAKRTEDYFKGKFVSFTIYAVLGQEEDKIIEKPTGVLKRLLSFTETDDFIRRGSFRKTASIRRGSYRNSLCNRRTVGAVTYSLDNKIFTQKLRNNFVSTPDIWRHVKEITSGIQTQPREGKKGSVELTLQYAVSEDGTNDVVEISVTKFRCSLQTMQEHERTGGQLYIKITAFEHEDLLQKMKSDKFDPTISLKLEANTATLRANVNNYNIEEVKILVRLISKNIVGKKVLLGKIEIDSKSGIWKEIVATPLVPITRMINFE